MKNKKLFAILTLICFALTMMPVAAFAAVTDATYAEIADGDEAIAVADKATLNIYNATSTSVYVYAKKADGSLFTDLTAEGWAATPTKGVLQKTGVAKNATAELSFKPGDYTVYVADGSVKLDAIAADVKATDATVLAALAAAAIDVDNNAVTVTGPETKYFITLDVEDVDVAADNGFTEAKVVVTVAAGPTEATAKAVSVPVTLTSNSPAVSFEKDVVTTGKSGRATTKLYGNIAGSFKVYASFMDTTVEKAVAISAMAPTVIKTVAEPTAPVALNSSFNKATGVQFSITDANGNNITDKNAMVKVVTANVGNYKVAVDAPKGATMKDTNVQLTFDKGWYLTSTAKFDKEGVYTFKVALQSGSVATATVNVKKFDKPVAIKIAYNAPTIELDGVNKLADGVVKFVDANGVTKEATLNSSNQYGVKLAASGYAVKSFDATTGDVTAKSGETYIGKTITVTAVSEYHNLVATTTMVVAKEAAAIKYANTKVELGVNNTIVGNVVDEDGNKVALNTSAAAVTFVILEKPENAKVSVVATDVDNLPTKGEFKASFTASQAGEYTIQTLVTYEQANGVVKYYTGIETFTVGSTGIKDVVVMSIGSNEIVINADKATIDAAPIVENNRTFVPFRALAEAFGATVDFDEATQSVTASLSGTTVVMSIGSAEYTVNGVVKTADVAPFISGSRTYVPVRFAAEAFGIKVTPTYDEKDATADVIFAK